MTHVCTTCQAKYAGGVELQTPTGAARESTSLVQAPPAPISTVSVSGGAETRVSSGVQGALLSLSSS